MNCKLLNIKKNDPDALKKKTEQILNKLHNTKPTLDPIDAPKGKGVGKLEPLKSPVKADPAPPAPI